MIQILGFSINSIQLDEIRSTCKESIDKQICIQCFLEVCRDTRKINILQQFFTDTRK